MAISLELLSTFHVVVAKKWYAILTTLKINRLILDGRSAVTETWFYNTRSLQIHVIPFIMIWIECGIESYSSHLYSETGLRDEYVCIYVEEMSLPAFNNFIIFYAKSNNRSFVTTQSHRFVTTWHFPIKLKSIPNIVCKRLDILCGICRNHEQMPGLQHFSSHLVISKESHLSNNMSHSNHYNRSLFLYRAQKTLP